MDSYTSGLKIGNKSQKPVLLSLLAFIASLVIVYGLFFSGSSTPVIHKAAVLLKGEGSASGKIYFEQSSKNAVVRITGKLTGLDPNALRGFHIHESGDVTEGCGSAGGHYNPLGKKHGGPTDSERHIGDLGNVGTDASGEVNIDFEDSTISLNGPLSIVGRSVVLHTGTDDLGLGGNEDSFKTGNAGGRAACGVIGVVKP